MNETITITHESLAELIAHAVASALAGSRRKSDAEKQRDYRERKKTVTGKVTANGETAGCRITISERD